MNKIITVAIREFVETVKTRAFIISTLFAPLLMMLMIFGSTRLAEMAEKEKLPTRRVAVVDHSGAVLPELAARVAEHNQELPQRPLALETVAGPAEVSALRERVNRGELYAYLIIPADAVAGDAPCELGRKGSQLSAFERLQRMVYDAVVSARFKLADPPVDLVRIQHLQRRVEFRDVDVASGVETTGGESARFLTPFAFMFFLFMGTMTISQGLLTSVIEEKSSRIVEVLLSAVSPTQLMAGKIMGMVGVGVLLMAIWGGAGYAGAHARGLTYLVTPYRLTHALLYFVPAFLLMSSFLAAIGSACNTLKEAQSMAFPVTILTVIPMMLGALIIENPTSTFSLVLSYIPPITPFVMVLRVCADPETRPAEVVATLVLLWLTVGFTIWAAGKIFRVGVLMYGKPPSLRELARWLRYA